MGVPGQEQLGCRYQCVQKGSLYLPQTVMCKTVGFTTQFLRLWFICDEPRLQQAFLTDRAPLAAKRPCRKALLTDLMCFSVQTEGSSQSIDHAWRQAKSLDSTLGDRDGQHI